MGFAKAPLRDGMRGIVTDSTRDNRRKVGFNVPIAAFLDVSDSKTRALLLDEGPIFEHVRQASCWR